MTNFSSMRKLTESRLVESVDDSVNAAHLVTGLDTTQSFYTIDGMSGKKYRFFINMLVKRLGDAAYLEVGSWAGSTLCAAIHGNKVRAVAIDNWSQFGGPKNIFLSNLEKFATANADVHFIEQDFRTVDYKKIGKFNIYLFDGPHSETDQYDGLKLALNALDREFVFIVDDWNWLQVRQGTIAAIRDCNLEILYATEIRTTLDNSQPIYNCKESDWHNGYYISVLSKRQGKSKVHNSLRQMRSPERDSIPTGFRGSGEHTMTLNELANKYGSAKGDKHHEAHGYAIVYEELLQEIRPNLTLLEIGSYDSRFLGASARMWRERLPRARLFEFDIPPDVPKFEAETGMRAFLVDQGSPEAQRKAMEQIGPVDFVVDNGSLGAMHIKNSLLMIWPWVCTAGYYVVENLHCSQSQPRYELDLLLREKMPDAQWIWCCGGKLLVIRRRLSPPVLKIHRTGGRARPDTNVS